MTHNKNALRVPVLLTSNLSERRPVQRQPWLKWHASLLLLILLLFIQPSPVLAAEAPDLGAAGSYTVLGTNTIPTSGTVTCTNSGPGSTIDGDVGSTFTSITNTGCSITGNIDAPVAGTVVTDFNNAFSELDSQNPTCDGVIPTTSTILPPGVYCSDAATVIGTGVTFTLNGSASDVWVFKVGTGGGGSLTGTGFSVVMGGDALACNVYWHTAEAATMTDSDFIGTVLAGTAITMTRGSWSGRALASTDVTVTDADSMTFAGCSTPSTITVNKNFDPDSSATVPVDLSCTSGTVSVTPLDASENSPAVFTVGGADLSGTTCTATETVPTGYTADQSNCVDVALGGSCTIINTLDSNSIVVNKNFIPDSTEEVAVALTCSSGAADATPLNASESMPAVFTVTGASPGATCTATETVPDGYTADQTDCVDVPLGSSCEIVNVGDDEPRATFLVTKNFTDDNPMDVEVAISCTTGLILDQTTEISEGEEAEFVIISFDEGELNCTVSETLVPGYSPAYTAAATTGLGLVSQDLEGCQFDEVVSGQFVCAIDNAPDPVDIEIEKLWVIDSSSAQDFDSRYSLRLYCDEPIGLVDVFEGEDSDTFLAQVVPQYPGTNCWVDETVYSSGVEIDNGCNNLSISAATGGDSCLITNTVFFEGIPVLGRYGMAILTLLMLGIGLFGFRRFV